MRVLELQIYCHQDGDRQRFIALSDKSYMGRYNFFMDYKLGGSNEKSGAAIAGYETGRVSLFVDYCDLLCNILQKWCIWINFQ